MVNTLYCAFTKEQYALIQQMIDASLDAEIARVDDNALATEGYVDDVVRNLNIDDKADGSVVNDVRSLEDTVSNLERRVSDVESNQADPNQDV